MLARAAILLAALTVACLLLAGCGSAAAGPASAQAAPRSPGPAPASVFGRALSNPMVTVTGGQLYVTWQVNQASAPVPRFELARADLASGAIEATHRLPAGDLSPPIAAGGWLWVTTSAAAGEDDGRTTDGQVSSLARIHALVSPATKQALPGCGGGEDCRYLRHCRTAGRQQSSVRGISGL